MIGVGLEVVKGSSRGHSFIPCTCTLFTVEIFVGDICWSSEAILHSQASRAVVKDI